MFLIHLLIVEHDRLEYIYNTQMMRVCAFSPWCCEE